MAGLSLGRWPRFSREVNASVGKDKEIVHVLDRQRVSHQAKRSEKGPGYPESNCKGLVTWPDHQAVSLQVGAADEHRRSRVQERAQPICPERLRRRAYRRAAQPAVRSSQVLTANAAAEGADANAPDQERQQ